jgi:hypothetical protein
MQNHAGLKNMCKKTRETCAAQSLWGAGGGGTQRIVGQCLKPSGSINQTVHLSWVVCLSLHLCDCTVMEQCRIIRIVGEKKHNLVH